MISSSFVVNKLDCESSLVLQPSGREIVVIHFEPQLQFFFKYFKALIDTVLSQNGFICDYIGWWSRLNKISDWVKVIDMVLGNIMEGTVTNNQVAPSHGELSGSLIVLVDVGRIP